MSNSEADLLRTLHDQHARALWSYVVGLTGGDRGKAEDVVQETMLRAWRHPDVLDQSRGSSRAWLFTVARRLVIDGWRSAQQRSELTTADPPERAHSDGIEELTNRAVIATAMKRLSLEHREVLLECYYRGSSVAQAAQTLQIPPGTVKSRTHYALHALRLAIAEIGGTR